MPGMESGEVSIEKVEKVVSAPRNPSPCEQRESGRRSPSLPASGQQAHEQRTGDVDEQRPAGEGFAEAVGAPERSTVAAQRAKRPASRHAEHFRGHHQRFPAMWKFRQRQLRVSSTLHNS